MTNENSGLFAAIGGIVAVFCIDCITKRRYNANMNKDSITLSPAGEEEKPQAADPEKNH